MDSTTNMLGMGYSLVAVRVVDPLMVGLVACIVSVSPCTQYCVEPSDVVPPVLIMASELPDVL